MINEIDIEKALDFIRDNSRDLAKAKADRIYLEQYRKSQKAILFQQAPKGTVQDRECFAYSHEEYLQNIEGLKVAVEEEEKLKWLMVAAQLKVEVYRTQQANNRMVDRSHA